MISLPVLFGVLLIGFLLLQVIPTDPATVSAGPSATQADIAAIRQQMGLDQPLWVQFGRYLARIVQFDLGRSMISNRAVSEEIALTLGPTIELLIACLIWAAPLGVLLGTLAARRHGSWIDRAIMALSVLGVSVPVFWIGLLYYFNVAQIPALAAANADQGGPGGAGIIKYVAPRALFWFRWAAVGLPRVRKSFCLFARASLWQRALHPHCSWQPRDASHQTGNKGKSGSALLPRLPSQGHAARRHNHST